MAAGDFVSPYLAKFNVSNGTGLLSGTATNYRIALVTSAWVPNLATNEVWADVSANEIASGNGYTTGGGTLTSVTLTQTLGVVKFTSAAFTWTAAVGSIPVWRYAVVYYLGTLNGKVNPLVAYCLGDSAPADVPITPAGQTTVVTPNASGIATY